MNRNESPKKGKGYGHGHEENDMSRQDRAKAKQHRLEREAVVLKDLADLEQAVEVAAPEAAGVVTTIGETVTPPATVLPPDFLTPEQMRALERKQMPPTTAAPAATVAAPVIAQAEAPAAPVLDMDDLAKRVAKEIMALVPAPAKPVVKAKPAALAVKVSAKKPIVKAKPAPKMHKMPDGAMMSDDEMAAQEAEMMDEENGKKKKMPKHDERMQKKSLLEQAWDRLIGRKEASYLTPIQLFKEASGGLRWVMVATNNRRDRDYPPQIITEAAHKEFSAYLDANPERAPSAWLWHTPGTAWGKADFWDYSNGFMVYSGKVLSGHENEATALAARKDLGVSHGMYVLKYNKDKALIEQYRTFELSPLLASRAANEWTSFHAIAKEVGNMSFTAEKRKFLAELIGEAQVAGLEKGTADAKAILDAIGVESKEQTDAPVVDKAVPAFLTKKPAAKKPLTEEEGKKPAPFEKKPVAQEDDEVEDEEELDAEDTADAPDAEEGDGAEESDAGDAAQEGVDARGESDALQKTIAALTEQVGVATEKISSLLAVQELQASKIKSLEGTEDQKLAALIRPRATPHSKGFRASAAPETALKEGSPEDAELQKSGPSEAAQFWAKEIMGRVTG